MNSSSEVTIQPNPSPLVMRQVEKWSDVVDQVKRTFDHMLSWEMQEFWILFRLWKLRSLITHYQDEIECFKKAGLSKARNLEAVAIRNNPKETPARRQDAARSIYISKQMEESFFRADMSLRKYLLLMIYTQRKLELRASLENY
jgi:hypothetical protein